MHEQQQQLLWCVFIGTVVFREVFLEEAWSLLVVVAVLEALELLGRRKTYPVRESTELQERCVLCVYGNSYI